MGGIRDPGRHVHVDADVVVATRHALPGVEPHPDADRRPRGPVVGGQSPLRGDRRLHGRRGAPEDQEEGVSLGADLDPAALRDGPAHDGGVLVPNRRVQLTDLLEQLRGPLDVGEQEGDRPGGQLSHGASNVARPAGSYAGAALGRAFHRTGG